MAMNLYYDVCEKRKDPTPRMRRRGARAKSNSAWDLLAFCDENYLDLKEVKVHGDWLSWESLETPEEVAQRVAAAEESQQSHLEAIKAMYAEYKERGLL